MPRNKCPFKPGLSPELMMLLSMDMPNYFIERKVFSTLMVWNSTNSGSHKPPGGSGKWGYVKWIDVVERIIVDSFCSLKSLLFVDDLTTRESPIEGKKKFLKPILPELI
jgi:hypothetical protein